MSDDGFAACKMKLEDDVFQFDAFPGQIRPQSFFVTDNELAEQKLSASGFPLEDMEIVEQIGLQSRIPSLIQASLLTISPRLTPRGHARIT